MTLKFPFPGLGEIEPWQCGSDRPGTHDFRFGGGEVFFGSPGTQRKMLVPERESSHDDAIGHIPGREVVIKSHRRNLVDQIDRNHLGNEGDFHRIRWFPGESLFRDLVAGGEGAEGRDPGGLFPGVGRMGGEEAGGLVGTQKRECALGDRDGQNAFALAAVGTEFEELRLQTEKLTVER